MSQNNRKHENNKKKQSVNNNTNNKSKTKKSTESKKKNNNVISEKQQQQHNRHSKSNLVVGDLKAQINYETNIDSFNDQSNAGDSPILSPTVNKFNGLTTTSTDSSSSDSIQMQMAIQESLEHHAASLTHDELEDDFIDISSDDEQNSDNENSDQESYEDLENWELMDEKSSSCLVNLNKPYNFSDIEFPVLSCGQKKSTLIHPSQTSNNPWLNSNVIKSITQQS